MRRRDLSRGAALAGAAAALPAAAVIHEPETSAGKPLGKIAMEEHFMVPEFMEYFAETYPNISADIAKLAPGALMDFGERRLGVMDEHHVDFVVLSLGWARRAGGEGRRRCSTPGSHLKRSPRR